MKIACGFEMMYQERKRAGEEGKGESWEVFLKNLESSGVFDGLLPGSKEYLRIMKNAEEYYKKSSLFSRTRDVMNAPLKRIDDVLALPYSTSDFNCSDLPPSDDDSWLYDGEDELNAAIAERQKEMELYQLKHKNRKSGKQELKNDNLNMQSDDFNFKDVAESMQAFIQKLSSFEGAEVPQNRNLNEVELDVNQFVKDMESVVGPIWHEKAANDANSEGSTSASEMDFDESEDGSDIAEPCGGDDSGDAFMESYSDALSKELNATTLKRSFLRASEQTSNDEEGTSKSTQDMEEELTPVDVDVNLVKSLLDSFSSQEGLPGPASNLLGLMGLNLPSGKSDK
ncbi:uncharacterized protein A4U43_C04F6090 [Asparagus officinalis]|uniref:Uncharacterized protein n=2 Tax=Asparagus officinalis TaxID=4686 RepID=A0A5P1F1C4_ASPOF|nr:uncharacterized protein A4U43_C04F6090 [Asparagus officinalis]